MLHLHAGLEFSWRIVLATMIEVWGQLVVMWMVLVGMTFLSLCLLCFLDLISSLLLLFPNDYNENGEFSLTKFSYFVHTLAAKKVSCSDSLHIYLNENFQDFIKIIF
ncbi:uncharacterized protein LOC129899439 [Solanum dulcamara]|uniref:uncharacterized protein LOC129899439 n=1 Tax=Solanum dulcamara TaxID=45834 RepID=UPI00248620ED|nr:uncharacterized protein LOC129899439 [Solanum dulcamara]